MRKSFYSLSDLVRNNLGSNPTNGIVFIFINRFVRPKYIAVTDESQEEHKGVIA